MTRKSPEINAGSMADIAFLLLIFFLVTTTMNVDSGISRVLPPIVDNPQQDDGVKVRERNVLAVKVSGNDMILAAGQRVPLAAVRDLAKEFAMNPTESEHLPEKEEIDIPLIGRYRVSKGVISLQNDRSTSYEAYLAVQNELTRAYNELRNEQSIKSFGREYADLTSAEKEAINKAIPVKISEAEPLDLTGKK